MIQVSGPGPYSLNSRRKGGTKMAREKCGHQRLALAYFSICPFCACIVWLGLGSEYTVDLSLQWIFAPPPSQGSLKGDMGVRGVIFWVMDRIVWFDPKAVWKVHMDVGVGISHVMDRIVWFDVWIGYNGTGLAFIDNVDEVSFIGDLNEGIIIGKSLSFFFFLFLFYLRVGLGFK